MTDRSGGAADPGPDTSGASTGEELQDGLRLLKSSFHSLLDGKRPSLRELAWRTGLSEGYVTRELKQLIESGRVVVEQDRVVGACGLSVVPTRHRLRLGRRTFYGWCAWDLVGIPAALGRSAVMRTPCGACGQELEVRIRNGRPPGRRQERGWLPDLARLGQNPRRDFCPFANLFCSIEHLDSWRAASPPEAGPGRPCDLQLLAEEGRREWRDMAS